jgi:hypothetical protein
MSRLAKAVMDVEGDQSIQRNGVLHYESVISVESKAASGVRYTIHRMSFGRRMELSRRVRELTGKIDFLKAGTETHEKIEANILAQEIDAMYLLWGLVSIDGLIIDGESATKQQLLEKGPEDLSREVVIAIKAQCGLSEAESKN